jgi:TIR domain
LTQICIFYDAEDRETVEWLDRALSRHWSIWWDKRIRTGSWRKHVEAELSKNDTGGAIVVWSLSSRGNDIVIDEAKTAELFGKPLFPVLIDQSEPPIGYQQRHYTNFSTWDGSPDHPLVQTLVEKIRGELENKRAVSREWHLRVGDKQLELPSFAWSVSSHETQLRPDAALGVARHAGAEAILASAYDVLNKDFGKRVISQMKNCRVAGAFVFLDSGNYEAYRRDDNRWIRSARHFHEAFEVAPCDIAFCHDRLTKAAKPNAIADEVIALVERDRRATGSNCVVPIVHAPRNANGDYKHSIFPEVCTLVSRHLRPTVVAVPERELGHGIIARAQMLREIRVALDELGWYQPIHVLGTGNPRSIAILSAVGGDSFDGLEWCRTVIDRSTYGLHHFQHYDFYKEQQASIGNELIRRALGDSDTVYPVRVVLHNLGFFTEIIRDVRTHLRNGKIGTLLAYMIGRDGIEKLRTAVPGIVD